MAVAENYNILPINLKSGSLEVRLAENSLEIDAAQALRYKVFYEEKTTFEILFSFIALKRFKLPITLF